MVVSYWGSVNSSPAIGPDGTIYFGSFDNYLYAVMLTPSVTSITPDSAANTGPVSITSLTGTGFVSGTTVKLSKAGQSINATSVVVVSSTNINCKFDLTGQLPDGGYSGNYRRRGIERRLVRRLPNNSYVRQFYNSQLCVERRDSQYHESDRQRICFRINSKIVKGGQSINATTVNVLNSAAISCTFRLNRTVYGILGMSS